MVAEKSPKGRLAVHLPRLPGQPGPSRCGRISWRIAYEETNHDLVTCLKCLSLEKEDRLMGAAGVPR